MYALCMSLPRLFVKLHTVPACMLLQLQIIKLGDPKLNMMQYI